MMNDRTIIGLLEKVFTEFRDLPAFTCLGKTLTYADVDYLSKKFAAYLSHKTHLQPGDRIAIQLPNLLQYPIAAYGALRAGLVIVNTNPLYTPVEVERQFRDAGVKALVAISLAQEGAIAIAKKLGLEKVIIVDPIELHGYAGQLPTNTSVQAIEKSASFEAIKFIDALIVADTVSEANSFTSHSVDATEETLALLQYTGGTTGVAKGAMLSHRNLVSNADQAVRFSGAYFRTGAECYVAALPMYHIYAFQIHGLALPSRGGHSLLIPNPRDIAAVVAAIKPHRITGFPGINTLFAALCANAEFRQLDLTSLRSTSAGGMQLTHEVAQQWRELTGITIAEGYGLSETSPVVTANPPGSVQIGTVGKPLPDTEIKVIDAQGNSLPMGERGELCVRGPQVMQGYWQKPEETALVLSSDGWFRTGDIAVIQADGYVRIVDRLKDMIVVSGFNVYPNEVEAVARKHPSVKECAAIGVPDHHSGEAVKLFVVPNSVVFDEAELRTFMRTELTGYKVPSIFQLVDDLPKSNVGKILRKDLR
ncbi:MAG: AMP-binding protein [Spongiibacteraceae bacterium]